MRKNITIIFLIGCLILLIGCRKEENVATASEEVKTPYILTHYGDDSTAQQMFYSIQCPSGEVVIIDGGWDTNSTYVESVIEQLGGKVDLWIVTHPHPDHVGAFNKIFAEGKYEIDKVYATDIDYNYYKGHAEYWDGFEEFEKFEQVRDDRVEYLYKGDLREIGGLQMEVLHAAVEMPDPCNSSSLVIKFTGDEDTFLLTGDVGGAIGQELYSQYSEKLKADYLQLSHHGNGGLGEEIYSKIVPKTAFVDAPKYLRENYDPKTHEPKNWTTPNNMACMENGGAKVYTWETAPNSVELY